jgi:Spirocyclase AveC-like
MLASCESPLTLRTLQITGLIDGAEELAMSQTFERQVTTARQVAPDRQQAFPMVLTWAALGALLFAFEIYVLARWIAGPHFASTGTGADTISSPQKALFIALQVIIPIAAAVALWAWVIRPWRREGRLTTDGMFALSGAMIFFWDMCMNFTSVTLLYNSGMVNFGAWANGAWPGWVSPNANRLPEPVFVTMPGYTALVFSQVLLILFIVRKIKARRPTLSPLAVWPILFVGLVIIDTIIESILLRMGIYAYPGGIRWLTLYSGHTYQLPMTEPVFFAGFGLGAIAALSYFRNDRNETVVERGIDTLSVTPARRQWIRFFAIFGAVHAAFAILYFVPNQLVGVHSGEFPSGYKSYMINQMCAYPGDSASAGLNACAGPGVPIPRP